MAVDSQRGELPPIELDRASGLPLSRQIAGAIRSAVSGGALRSGDRLPAERSLCRALGVDRMTVARAYEELASEGLVVREVGRGSFVRGRTGKASRPHEAVERPMRWARAFASRVGQVNHPFGALQHTASQDGAINLSSLYPDPDLFPLDEFRAALNSVMKREGARLFGYGSAEGYGPLRKYLAESLTRRGAAVTADEIVITNGSQQGIDLVARSFLDPGDPVVLEDPTYTGAVHLFQAHGASVVGVPLDPEGMDPVALDDLLSRSGARLIYLIPNFQNPTSGTMSLKRRQHLLEVALRHGVPILEDDFGGDLRYEGAEQPSLKALDIRGEGVVYVGTFAKKLAPGLRIGWIAAPPEVVSRLVALKRVTDWSTSPLLQAALHEFCARGHLDAHLDRVVSIYRQRRDAMLGAMRKHFPADVRWTRPEGGLVVWVTLPQGVDAEETAVEARTHGVLVSSGDLFFIRSGPRTNLRMVFGQAGLADIEKGIRILGRILDRRVREADRASATGTAESLPVL
jgi:GntR family transcriptional regulator/MocR family aminotransferase